MTEEFIARTEFNDSMKEIRTDLNDMKTSMMEMKVILAQQGANVWKYLSLSSISFIAGIVTDIALKALHIG